MGTEKNKREELGTQNGNWEEDEGGAGSEKWELKGNFRHCRNHARHLKFLPSLHSSYLSSPFLLTSEHFLKVCTRIYFRRNVTWEHSLNLEFKLSPQVGGRCGLAHKKGGMGRIF